MSRVTVFSVQPYWRRGRELLRGDVRQFRSQTLALNAGTVASYHAAGVIVFTQQGEPEFDSWSEPEVIATHGEVPDA